LIPVDPQEVVGVLIASEGLVRHIRMELQEPVAEEELLRIERFLNQELAGMPLSHVDDYLERALLEAKDTFFQLYKRAFELLSLDSLFEEEVSLILEGTSAILEAPEFQDIGRTRRLLRGLEAKEELAELLRRDLSADEVRFHIGSENRDTSLTDCTIAAAPYRLRGGLTGALGVLGPTRMDYPRVSALVWRAAQAVTRAFEVLP
jgi:heat-inducible transcriptional repressor